MAICNATGGLGPTIARVQAEAYARWQFNHTNQWIDALFTTHYRLEGAAYAQLARTGAAPRMVAAEDGLGESELQQLIEEANATGAIAVSSRT